MTPHKCNNKADGGVHVDRISDLPCNVMDIILSKLPIKELVRTSILSRKWRYMWNSVPKLEFDDHFFEEYQFPYDPKITDIINEVLMLHNGPVYEFTVHIPFHFNLRIDECLGTWILFLSRRGLKDLWLENNRLDLYQMPPHIFSCPDLTHLELKKFELSLPPNFHGFKSLTELHLFEVRVESNALENLILGSPCLEYVTLSRCYGFEFINVSAPSVRDLCIDQVSDVKPICLKNVDNLIELTLTVFDIYEENFERHLSDLIEDLPKLERFCVGGSYIKILSEESIPQTVKRSLNYLKYLELNGVNFNGTEDLLLIIYLLESSPSLVELMIKSYTIASELVHTSFLNEIECKRCCLSKLKTVNISVETANECALTLTRFVLANAPSLETLTFKVSERLYDSDDLLIITRKLLRMERASQRAKIEFLELKEP